MIPAVAPAGDGLPTGQPPGPGRVPLVGQLVQVRSRHWLVEEVTPPSQPGRSARVSLACADDDNQGQSLTVLWDYELDRQILDEEAWADLGAHGFDPPREFSAYLNTLKWNCVTATDPDLFQSPFRAGIRIDPYQMEPLRKALQLPRVNLFIADDTGLGKTIEAGLIARELLLRKKVRTIVIATPASVLEQWQGEMEERFGLRFEILNREYLTRMRRERGFTTNPWKTHTRFLISHNLLVDPLYADPMRAWLGGASTSGILPGSLLVLDEAHHAAPSSGGKYGIVTKFTKAVRDLSRRFEHRLFLSATPHNGHSSSFATLLELLDPYRFTRGVKARPEALGDVMVRRLKEDLRAIQGGFPERKVVRIPIRGLPADAPELVLSRLLDDYRGVRDERFRDATKRTRASAGLLVTGLQQRLLSSTEAFARALRVHRKTVARMRLAELGTAMADAPDAPDAPEGGDLLWAAPGADDDRGELGADALQAEEDTQFDEATEAVEAGAGASGSVRSLWAREDALLDQMQELAEATRHEPDAKLRWLIDWIRTTLCPGLPPFGSAPPAGPAPRWNDRRVIIFTENREGTKAWLRRVLSQAIEGTHLADDRIAVIDGLVAGDRRKEIQRRFNAPPGREPLRILLATDAAREGLNFQAHCTDLFHFDLPWNPGRIEQRNGRIDRKLQPAAEVRCHYFVLEQRVEDRVLEVLVRKTETIRKELGSLSTVIDDRVERALRAGIRHADADAVRAGIEGVDLEAGARDAMADDGILARRLADEAAEQAEATRRQREIRRQVERCEDLIESSRRSVGFAAAPFRDALSCSLQMLHTEGLREERDDDGVERWVFPPLEQLAVTDASWLSTLDTLRAPRRPSETIADWRRSAQVRPVVFDDAGVLTDDTVHLHLDQRVAQRLLARFRAHGFVQDDLSRACLVQTADSVTRVVLLGRLSLYGRGAERLHEEIISVTSRWYHPDARTGALQPYARDAEARTLDLLASALRDAPTRLPADRVTETLLAAARQDIAELLPRLEPRGMELADVAKAKLLRRGEVESASLRDTLDWQRDHVRRELARHDATPLQLALDFSAEDLASLEADRRHWRHRLTEFDADIASAPGRYRDFYQVQAQRIEPVGLVYLVPAGAPGAR